MAAYGSGLALASPAGPGQRQPPFFSLQPHGDQKGMDRQRHGHMPVPSLPGAYFVFIESAFLLGSLKPRLNGPVPTGHLHQGFQRHVLLRGKRDVISQPVEVFQTTAHQQPMTPGLLLGR